MWKGLCNNNPPLPIRHTSPPATTTAAATPPPPDCGLGRGVGEAKGGIIGARQRGRAELVPMPGSYNTAWWSWQTSCTLRTTWERQTIAHTQTDTHTRTLIVMEECKAFPPPEFGSLQTITRAIPVSLLASSPAIRAHIHKHTCTHRDTNSSLSVCPITLFSRHSWAVLQTVSILEGGLC